MVSEGWIRILEDGPDLHFVFRDGSRFVAESYQAPLRSDASLTLREFNQGSA